MPIENEIKYVLDKSFNQSLLDDWNCVSITQGYLNENTRIRKYGNKYFFTYKKWLSDKNYNLEIETEIEKPDFDSLWPFTTQKVYKTRYNKTNSSVDWSIDFIFSSDNNVYFILAEAEMDEELIAPASIPEIIKNYILYTVPKGNQDYTNIALSDIEHANQLYNNLVSDQ